MGESDAAVGMSGPPRRWRHSFQWLGHWPFRRNSGPGAECNVSPLWSFGCVGCGVAGLPPACPVCPAIWWMRALSAVRVLLFRQVSGGQCAPSVHRRLRRPVTGSSQPSRASTVETSGGERADECPTPGLWFGPKGTMSRGATRDPGAFGQRRSNCDERDQNRLRRTR